MGYLKVYTRKPIEEIYPNSLANSVHFAYSPDGEEFVPLNRNYGILFALADIRDDDTIAERGAGSPTISREGDTYIICARKLDAGGNALPDGSSIRWRTRDFVTFSEQELIDEVTAEQLLNAGNIIEITAGQWAHIKARWMPLHSKKVEFPKNLHLHDISELDSVSATVTYSDGSTDTKKVCWDRASLISSKDGKCFIRGRIEPVRARFPLAVGYADPVIFPWKGFWYFLATNDNVDDIGIFVRKADSVDGLFEGAAESCILDYDQEKGFVQTFWAPEFHVIGDELYILFAVSGTQWGPQCHMMRLKKDGDIMNPSDWEEPVRVIRPDGKALTEDGITLDMTYFKAQDKPYLVWSYRRGIGTPLDTGSMLYIAAADEDKPWQLASDPVLLSRPLYGWENNSGTINNEGPYALLLDNMVYLAYSGGAACGYSYVVGYLTARAEDDLLDVRNWHKQPSPMLSSASIDGIEGPGHNSFFRDEDGRLMIAYHAQERDRYNKRCTAIHRVHLSKSGMPMLNVAGTRDVAIELQIVELEFTV